MFAAIGSLTAMGVGLGFGLAVAARRFKVEGNPLVAEVEALMPGSQCGQCGYPGCTPAAEAIATGDAPLTACPPGGRALAEALAAKLGRNADFSDMQEQVPQLARIRDEDCTGCTKCFKVCPTDAIVGGPKQLHGIVRDACIGCGKCAEVCPTETIVMFPIPVTLRTWYWPKPLRAV
jgi:electron transport complex protein RnfB